MIEIKHRHTGAVLFSGDYASLRAAVEAAVAGRVDLTDAYLGGAYLGAADLSGADLSRADLCGADLSGADLSRADLCGADLSGADLHGANLCGADLSGADLLNADLIDAGQDMRGYRFVGWLHEGIVQIRAGCRSLTLAEGREHWGARHADNPERQAECLAKLDLIEAVATARGWMGIE